MKLLFITIILSLSVVLSQTPPTNIYSVSTTNGIDYIYNSVMIRVGAIVATDNIQAGIGTLYGIFNASNEGFYIIGSNQTNINLFFYETGSNLLNYVSYVNTNYYYFAMQPLGFSPSQDTIYLSGGSTGDNNVTIFSWDFYNHEFTFLELPFETIPITGQINGAYDPITGNYFVTYSDPLKNIHVATYNIPASFLVSDNIIPQFKSGVQVTYTQLFYASGQLYAVVGAVQGDITLYTVSFKSGSINRVYSISNPYFTQSVRFVNNDNYVVFITSNAQNSVIYTTIELENYTQVYQTSSVPPVQQAYSSLLYTN